MRGSEESSWLRVRLWFAAAFGLLAVAIPIGAGIWVISTMRDALGSRVREDQLSLARTVGEQLSQGLNFAEELVRATAHRRRLVDAVQRSDRGDAEEVLVNAREAGPYLAGATVVLEDGSVLAASGAPVRTVSPAERLDPAVVGADARIQLVRVIPGTGAELRTEVSLDRLAPVARAVRFGRTGTAAVIDDDGDILLTGEPRRRGGQIRVPELTGLIDARRAGTVRYEGRLVPREELAAYAPIQHRPWGVIVTQATSEAFTQVDGLRRIVRFVIALLVAVGLAVAVLVGQLLARYERRLRERVDAEQRSKHELERLNSALGSYGSRAAHDLRTPLATVSMASATLEQEPLTDRGRKGVQMVRDAAKRGIELVEALLELARASGTPTLERVQLAPLVRDASAGIEGVDLRLCDDAEIVVDPITMRQSLHNLMQNASRYAQQDGVATLEVTCEAAPDGWTLSVADRGPGIPPEEADRLFGALERGSTARGTQGSGLGLAIVAAAADAHGGRVWYEPRPGGGSIFKMFLPRREPEDGEA